MASLITQWLPPSILPWLVAMALAPAILQGSRIKLIEVAGFLKIHFGSPLPIEPKEPPSKK